MRRLLAMVLAGWLAVFGSSVTAAQARGDFIAAMTVDLAVDPAKAARAADDRIARHAQASTAAEQADLAAAHWVRAQASFRLGDGETARVSLAAARRLAPDDRAGRRVRAYASLLDGLLARGAGNYATALTQLQTAQQGFIAVGDRRGQALALQSVAVLYNDVGNGDDALRYLTLAEDIYAGDSVFRLSLNNNFGVALQSLERFREAEVRLVAARDIADSLGIASFSRQITLNIAANQAFSGELTAARQSLTRFDTQPGEASAWQQSEAHRLRAIIAWRDGNRAEAIAQTRSSLATSGRSSTDTSFWPMHHAAYQIFDAYGLRDDAYEQLQAVRRLEEIEAELTASNRAALLSAQFQFAAQNTQIAQLKADNLEREVNFQRTMTITIVIGSLLALALLASLLAIAIRARNRARADGAELAVVNQRLETALAAKTEFLASTSHELRTPLNGILGMAQILLADSAIAPRHRSQIELLHDAGSTMRALVDDILDVAKIEHGGFTITAKPTDVAELAARVTRLFAAQAQGAGLTLDLVVDGDSPQAMLDPDRLTQILFNLIGNAIKFTPEGLVQVSVRTSGEGAANDGALPMLHIAVRDSGIGIAAEWHDSVFDMFRQVDGARTRNYGGTGLGLAICRQLARAMGGDIALDSAPGEGSTFAVSLPWRAVPVADERIVSVSPHQLRDSAADPPADSSVVVIAHDPMRIAMLTAIVRRSGAAVSVADTGDRIQAAMTSPKSLTLLVDASAWALIETIIDDCADSGHAVIVVGGTDGEAMMMQAECAGAAVVAFSRNAIVAALRDAAPSNRAQRMHSRLPAASRGAIAQGQTRSEPKRSARMSRK